MHHPLIATCKAMDCWLKIIGNESTLPLELSPDGTINDALIAARAQGLPESSLLSFGGVVLDDPTLPLADLGIGTEAVLHETKPSPKFDPKDSDRQLTFNEELTEVTLHPEKKSRRFAAAIGGNHKCIKFELTQLGDQFYQLSFGLFDKDNGKTYNTGEGCALSQGDVVKLCVNIDEKTDNVIGHTLTKRRVCDGREETSFERLTSQAATQYNEDPEAVFFIQMIHWPGSSVPIVITLLPCD